MVDPNEVERIASRPFTRALRPSEDGGFSASVVELPGCISEGETAAQAAERLEEALRAVIESMLEHGQPIPSPSSEELSYSGHIALRVPPSLHARAAQLAAAEGVSLNRWLSNAIAYYAGMSSAGASSTRVAESETAYPSQDRRS
jgi:antitoxin HicB